MHINQKNLEYIEIFLSEEIAGQILVKNLKPSVNNNPRFSLLKCLNATVKKHFFLLIKGHMLPLQ